MSNLAKYLMAAAGNSADTPLFKDAADYSHVRFDKINIPASTNANGIAFKPDGTVVYTMSADDTVRQQSLSTPWDISTHGSVTASFTTNQSTNHAPLDLTFKPDGTRIWICNQSNGNIAVYDLTTAWDISTASYSTFFDFEASTVYRRATVGIEFKPDGTECFVMDNVTDSVRRFVLNTAWDITSGFSSTSPTSIALDLNSTANERQPRGLHFSDDGKKIYFVGAYRNRVYNYNLTTAYDISTSSGFSGNPASSLYINAYEASPFSLTFSPSGEHMYVVGGGDDGVDQFVRT